MNTNDLLDAIGAVDEREVAAARETGRRTRFAPLKTALVAAVIAALLLGAVPGLAAADVSPAYDLVYTLNPALAQRLKPVRRQDESSGVRMEVDAARVTGDTAEILISLKDLQSGRIDRTTDLFDSYAVRCPYDMKCGCTFSAYDDESGAAVFALELQTMHGEPIADGKVTFSLSQLLVGKRQYDRTEIPLDASDVAASPAWTENVSFRGGSAAEDPHVRKWADERLLRQLGTVMQPDGAAGREIVDGVTLTGVGYRDGWLRIQLCYRDILRTDNHGFLWLEASDGTRLESPVSESFWADGHVADGRGNNDAYQEYFFPVEPATLASYSLCGDFTTCDTLIEGDWQVTFPLA